MVQLGVNSLSISWYMSFLTNRVQRVKVNKTMSSATITNVGVPQGCVNSPILFTLYTDDCQNYDEHQHFEIFF